MAENIGYDNTNSGQPCTDTQCMIDCIASKIQYGASYTCPAPSN